MAFHQSVTRLVLAVALVAGPFAEVGAQTEAAACGSGSEACVASCARFGEGDPRLVACEKFCGRNSSYIVGDSAQCTAATVGAESVAQGPVPEVRAYSRKADALRERELNGKMTEAISRSNLQDIRRLIEMKKGLNPTYVYAYDFNPQTRQYEGRAARLRLTDIFNDPNTFRSDEEGLDKILALFIELGMDVTARLPQASSGDETTRPAAARRARTAWGPSLKLMERARDRSARMRAFEITLEEGLKPNDDTSEWLFAELPQVCGRDRSEFAIQVVDLLVKYFGATLQDDFWRAGERGPETVSDVLDRMMSPGKIPRSHYERTEFAMMDETWENCALLSRRINRYLTQGN